jgi:hypothetical protein
MPAADDIDTMVKRRAWLEQDDKPYRFHLWKAAMAA